MTNVLIEEAVRHKGAGVGSDAMVPNGNYFLGQASEKYQHPFTN